MNCWFTMIGLGSQGGERWVWDGRRGERQGRLGVVSLFGYFVDGFIRMCYGVGNAFSNEGCG